ncbi:MAG TPA: hypothetical protein PLE74_06875 [Candidatus Cloacimonadota bacterium]|nr:hypothetical protein [Candidatus Cloacimonadota bacterium]HPT71988.1 hypothetical protein [Candidatus Cloacimonadota bacterium]
MKKLILLFIPVLLLLSACSDLTSPKRFKESQYTLSALLIAGTSISPMNPVIVGKSVDISQLNSPDMFISNAVVNITESFQEAEITTFGLVPYSIPVPNSTDMITVYIDPNHHFIQPEHKYHIEIQIPGYSKTIIAETTVPKQAQLEPDYNHLNIPGQGFSLTLSDSLPVIPFNRVNADYPLALKVDGEQTVNTLFELYCLEDFSTDLEFTTTFLGQEHPPASMESDYYASSGETIRRINFLARMISKQADDGQYYILLNDYKQGFIFYGRYMVTSNVIDDNYYYYKFKSDGYLYGGVVNGIGCFGSESGGTMYTKIVK